MRYDVCLVATEADRTKADLVAKRLRALKLKTRLCPPGSGAISDKDKADIKASRSVLVLWSKAATAEDKDDAAWVNGMALMAAAGDDRLVQAVLDKSAPPKKLAKEEVFSLSGFGPKRMVSGFVSLADFLGAKMGRAGLADWIKLKPAQKDEKAAWKAAHPDDPLSQAPKPRTKTVPRAPAETVLVAAPVLKRTNGPPVLRPPKPPRPEDQPNPMDVIMIFFVGLGIAFLFLFSYISRSSVPPPEDPEAIEIPAIGNAGRVFEPGDVPPPLDAGDIIDDTEDE